ncbi:MULTISPECIES: LpqB family beta-propeller domain-containing protein [unclassified Salinibacterium]|uniref:LpqB family beta-propeller domain-containing protein n=1 Tax=unclassified Salinibacterium TaxID=2632331 RepID=UPI00143E01CD|nr:MULTISPECIES: LpqB family beta-propeller domain-containing protein [unclassified Salinibacterium]
MRERGSTRRLAAVLALLAMAIPLAACSGIPSSGDVVTGSEVSQQDPGGAEYIVEGPAEGDSMEQILRGFISAFKGSGNYDVARQFLSSGFVNEWEPRESVLVHSGSINYVAASEDTMDVVVGSATASVDAAGSYRRFSAAPSTLHYEFVREEGEWRISAAPNGILLSESQFDNVFSEHVLYFVDPGGTALVPDLRWFPAGPTAATRVMSALLAGPPAWLEGAATTAFPAGTQLTSPKRVAVEGSVASVDLTSEALAAPVGQRQLMRLQIESSLDLVTAVSISVDGSPFEIPDPSPGMPQPRYQVDNRPLVLDDGKFGYSANGQISPIDGLSEQVEALSPRAVTLARGGGTAAVLNQNGVAVVRRNSEPVLLDSRPGLVAPDLDGYGYVWSVPADAPAALRALAFDGTVHEITSNLPADARVADMEVSRDGARIAILLATPAGPRLLVSAIVRGTGGSNVPTTLGVPVIDTTVPGTDARGIAWVDGTTVATLTATGPDVSVVAHQVGGSSESLGGPDDAVQIVGGNGEAGLRVLGADGSLSARRPSGWQTTQITADVLAVQR